MYLIIVTNIHNQAQKQIWLYGKLQYGQKAWPIPTAWWQLCVITISVCLFLSKNTECEKLTVYCSELRKSAKRYSKKKEKQQFFFYNKKKKNMAMANAMPVAGNYI